MCRPICTARRQRRCPARRLAQGRRQLRVVRVLRVIVWHIVVAICWDERQGLDAGSPPFRFRSLEPPQAVPNGSQCRHAPTVTDSGAALQVPAGQPHGVRRQTAQDQRDHIARDEI